MTSSFYKAVKHRNGLSKIFVTFPQSGLVTKQDLLDKYSLLNLNQYYIVRETHQDGNYHLHAIFTFKTKYPKTKLLQSIAEWYPNDYKRIDIQSIISLKNAVTYLQKEDKDPLTNFPKKEKKCSYNLIYSICNNEFPVDMTEQDILRACWCHKCRERLDQFNDMETIQWLQKLYDLGNIEDREIRILQTLKQKYGYLQKTDQQSTFQENKTDEDHTF